MFQDDDLEGGLRWKGSYTRPLVNDTRKRVTLEECSKHSSDYVGLTNKGFCSHGKKLLGKEHKNVHCWGYGKEISSQGGEKGCTVVYSTKKNPPVSGKIGGKEDVVKAKKKGIDSMTQEECAAYAEDKGSDIFYLSTTGDKHNPNRKTCYLSAEKAKSKTGKFISHAYYVGKGNEKMTFDDILTQLEGTSSTPKKKRPKKSAEEKARKKAIEDAKRAKIARERALEKARKAEERAKKKAAAEAEREVRKAQLAQKKKVAKEFCEKLINLTKKRKDDCVKQLLLGEDVKKEFAIENDERGRKKLL